jgi:hypothetical protein
MAKKGQKTRCTAAEKNYRIHRVARLLSNGAVRSEIIDYGCREWGVEERTVGGYINAASEVLKSDWDIDRRTFTAELLSQLASLQKECRKNGNQAHVALGCINTMAKIAHILEK